MARAPEDVQPRRTGVEGHPAVKPWSDGMVAAVKRELRHVSVAVLDANPILAEAMCRHVRSSQQFGHEAVSLTWDRMSELDRVSPLVLVLDPAEAPAPIEDVVVAFRNSAPEALLVAYASDPTQELARACMGLGFRAFIPKSADSGQLITALRAVANGGMYIDRRFAAALLPPVASEVPERSALSSREEAILRRISLGMSHKQIATELGLSHKTVDTYRARGMRKLDLSDRGELVRFALKQGWLAG